MIIYIGPPLNQVENYTSNNFWSEIDLKLFIKYIWKHKR